MRRRRPAVLPAEVRRGRKLAFKTGTSYGYRDFWAIGYDPEVTIGVWAGRPDGTPMPGHSGRLTAAPILFKIADLLGPSRSRNAAAAALRRPLGRPERSAAATSPARSRRASYVAKSRRAQDHLSAGRGSGRMARRGGAARGDRRQAAAALAGRRQTADAGTAAPRHLLAAGRHAASCSSRSSTPRAAAPTALCGFPLRDKAAGADQRARS